jgi:hypothetical protein
MAQTRILPHEKSRRKEQVSSWIMTNPTKNVTQVQLSPNQKHLYYLQHWLLVQWVPYSPKNQEYQLDTSHKAGKTQQIKCYLFTNSSALYNGLVKSTEIWLATDWTVRKSKAGRAIFSASFETRPGANPASCTMGSGSVSQGKRSGSSLDHPPPSSANVKDRVPLLPSGPSWPVLWWPLPFTFNSYLIPRNVFFRPTQNNSIWNGIIPTKGLRLQVGCMTI